MAECDKTLCHVDAFLWLPEPVVGCPASLCGVSLEGLEVAQPEGSASSVSVLWGRGGGYRNWQ